MEEAMDTTSNIPTATPSPIQIHQQQIEAASASAQSSINSEGSNNDPNSANNNNDISPETSGFSLSDLVLQLEDYTPTLPDSVTNHFLQMAGFESSDIRMTRLISISAQKYISDIVNEAYNHSKLKNAAVQSNKNAKKQEKKFSLTLEDLTPVLAEYGITVKKPPYYV